MSTMHRILASAFGRARRTVPVNCPAAPQTSSPHQADGSGTLTCAPWMGLYFEDHDLA
ncbi:hypothetical protein ACFQ36_16130 [Arthrobacter sp. GCM10027362]|uniref:hypothetical protein n=1 Tax=Arthrobacter sp. GCM10027362 TaxID=3273379 RepID=UPI00362E5F22